MAYLHKYGWPFRMMYPSFIWKPAVTEPTIFLTFDDGPIPEVTEFVLDELKKFDAKASFFCVGENIKKHPKIFKRIVQEGHAVGNHTQHHMNGREHSYQEYVNDLELCDSYLKNTNPNRLYRPPYGRLTYEQMQYVKERYKVVMWDVLSADFHPSITAEMCLKKSVAYTENGSVVLFHDNIKTYDKIRYALPRYLQHFKDLNYQFKSLNDAV